MAIQYEFLGAEVNIQIIPTIDQLMESILLIRPVIEVKAR